MLTATDGPGPTAPHPEQSLVDEHGHADRGRHDGGPEVGWDDDGEVLQLVEARSMAEARARGWVRMEGKDYVMQDGDVVEFRFNV